MGAGMDVAFNAAGGLALFLLAMTMLTDGLKVFGGQGLKRLLRDWTSTKRRGVLSGALVTAMVQSSSAVTVATIGFVNANVLSLRQALAVIFGANVGTTMTGWLVSLIGFGFRIEALALPILAVGVAIRLLAPGKRVQGLGTALAGFGLFFLGLALLKDAFGGFAAQIDVATFGAATDVAGLAAFVGVGIVATVLTQSSSAAIALILTAATQQVIGIEAAAAAIIGANIGTTSTAMLAVIGATPNARRVAAGHLAFNLVTAIVALALLPLVLAATAWLGGWAGLGGQPAPLLALFHTAFNLLGVAIMLPLTDWLASRLGRMFRTAEEDISQPRHLDRTILGTPALAVLALHQELARLAGIVRDLALAGLRPTEARRKPSVARAEAARALALAIGEFVTSARMETLPRDVAEELPRVLRVARYLEEAAQLVPEAEALRAASIRLQGDVARQVERTLSTAATAVDLAGPASALAAPPATDAVAAFRSAYQAAKAALLAAAAARTLDIEAVDSLLDRLSHTQRMVDQVDKGGRLLAALSAGASRGEITAAAAD